MFGMNFFYVKCFNCVLDSDITEEYRGHILKIEDEVNA